MKRFLPPVGAAVAVLVTVLTGCGTTTSSGSGATATPSASPATTAAAAPAGSSSPTAAATVATHNAGGALGTILVDDKGKSLYLFQADTTDKSTCNGTCAVAWPPQLTKGNPKAGSGIKKNLLGTTKRSDGTTQVTYNKHPLYYYVADTEPGQTNGQGLDQFGALWYVLNPEGKQVTG
jgi:predicted lipoprotein with Yx(FWY)xxD motif